MIYSEAAYFDGNLCAHCAAWELEAKAKGRRADAIRARDSRAQSARHERRTGSRALSATGQAGEAGRQAGRPVLRLI